MATDSDSGASPRYPPRDPVPDSDPRYADPRRCGHWGYRRSDKSLCLGWVVKGTKKCPRHSGKSRAAAVAEGLVVTATATAMQWGMGSADIDPGEVLLRLVAQSAARCDLYASLLQEAYEAGEQLKAANDAGESTPGDVASDRLTVAEDLKRIFNAGGVAALVGNTYAATKDGDIYATGEAIRGLAQLEAVERDRCAGFAAKAKAAGLAERQVQVAEQQVQMVGRALEAVFAEIGLSLEQAREARRGLARHLRLAAS